MSLPLTLKRLLRGFAPLLVVLAIYGLWNTITPTPFSYKGDMYILAAPMARFISLSWLSGHVPAISWLMGDGFNPWLSGQSGVLYPIYPLAMLLAKLFRREYLLLEFTAVLDFLIIAYYIFMSPLFRKASFNIRLTLVVLFVAQPSAVILGQNWCYFLNTYTWCLISMGNMLSWQRWPSKPRYGWWTLGSLLILFSAINAQMYPFFMVLCILPALLAMERQRWRAQATFALLLSIILIPPFLCIWWASQNGNPAWMTGRDSVDTALAFGQTLPTVMKGVFFGNLAGSGFSIWQGVSGWGSGIFLVTPAALLGLFLAKSKDRKTWLIMVILMVILMGIASLPFLKWIFVGPFARFRWTWKFAIFLPAIVLACISSGRPERRSRLWTPVLLFSAGLSLLVASRGLLVDFFPSQIPIRNQGVHGLLKPASELKARLGLKPGERIVPVGRMNSMDQLVPMAWLAMIGNAPSLVDISSIAIYDPLEPAASANLRGGLSTPWREALPDQLNADQFERVDAFLGRRGTAVYLFKEHPHFTVPANEPLGLSNGELVWAVRSRHWQPWVSLQSGNAAPVPTPWGELVVPQMDQIKVITARELTQFPDPGPNSEIRQIMKVSPTGYPGPWVLRFPPLGNLGPWVGLWYLLFFLTFIIAWWRYGTKLTIAGLPPREKAIAFLNRVSWLHLALGMGVIFLVLRIPLLLGPQPISDAVMAYPGKIMIMVQGQRVPYQDIPFEYPPLTLIPLLLAGVLAKGSVWVFRLGFATQMFFVDAALFTSVMCATRQYSLRETTGPGTTLALAAGLLYLAATQPLGCLLYDRLDIAVAAFIALPLLLKFSGIVTRPSILGALVALGFWFKLVPVIALAPLALWEWGNDQTSSIWRRLISLLVGFALSFTLIGVCARSLFGPALWDFFKYHLARPIEIGSIWASMDFLLTDGVRPVFEYGGWHLKSEWLSAWKSISAATTLIGLIATFLLGFRAINRNNTIKVCSLVALGSLLSFIGFGKVLSPQFFLWFAPLLPLLVWQSADSPDVSWVLGGCLGVVGMTALYFPSWHYALVGGDGSIWIMVALRNALCLTTLIGIWILLFSITSNKYSIKPSRESPT